MTKAHHAMTNAAGQPPPNRAEENLSASDQKNIMFEATNSEFNDRLAVYSVPTLVGHWILDR